MAPSTTPRATAGRARERMAVTGATAQGVKPPAGRRCRATAKTMMSRIPATKLGTAMPTWLAAEMATPEGQGHGQPHDQAQPHQGAGDREGRADLAGDGAARYVGAAQVPRHQPPHPAGIALPQGLVEAQLGAEGMDGGGGGLGR